MPGARYKVLKDRCKTFAHPLIVYSVTSIFDGIISWAIWRPGKYTFSFAGKLPYS